MAPSKGPKGIILKINKIKFILFVKCKIINCFCDKFFFVFKIIIAIKNNNKLAKGPANAIALKCKSLVTEDIDTNPGAMIKKGEEINFRNTPSNNPVVKI